MATKKFVTNLVSDFEYLATHFPSIMSIKAQRSTGYPLLFKVNYLQGNYREATLHNLVHQFSFDPRETPSIKKLSEFPGVEGFVTESLSPSKNFRAVVRPSPEKTLLEIWGKTGLQKSIRISDFHGVFYPDQEFVIESISWSQDEKRVAYLAEPKAPSCPNLFSDFKTDEEAQQALKSYGCSFHLGEGFFGKCWPMVFVYDFEEDQISQVMNIPDNIMPTQVSFADKAGRSMVFCGYTFKDIKLGMKYTANRECKVYLIQKLALKGLKPNAKSDEANALDEKSKPIALTTDYVSLAPIISSDFKRIVYAFSHRVRSILLHLGLKVIELGEDGLPINKEPTIIIDPTKDTGVPDFFGIGAYQGRVTKGRLLGNSNYYVVNSYTRNALGVFLINLETKEVRRIDNPKYKSGECRFESVEGETIFASFSNQIGEREFAVFSGLNTAAKTMDEALVNAKWHHYDLNAENFAQMCNKPSISLPTFEDVEEHVLNINGVESVLFTSKLFEDKKRPLVAYLHGGPHGNSTGFYAPTFYYALANGYNVLYINFTGSIGFGQKFLEELLGKAGRRDAEDVKAVLEHCCQNGWADPKNLMLIGLSYGGFLALSVVSKYPELVRSIVLYNPMVSFINMYEGSDVSDWSFAEVMNVDLEYDGITGDSVKKMHEAAPLGMSYDIKSSILFMLGGKDRRIFNEPAMFYHKLLKRKGVDSNIAFYPNDEHPLQTTPASTLDQFVKVFAFFDEKKCSHQ